MHFPTSFSPFVSSWLYLHPFFFFFFLLQPCWAMFDYPQWYWTPKWQVFTHFESDLPPLFSCFIILQPNLAPFSRAHLLGDTINRAILHAQSWRYSKYQVNERLMISNHLPECSTCITSFCWNKTMEDVDVLPPLTAAVPLISLVAMGISCVVKQIQSS